MKYRTLSVLATVVVAVFVSGCASTKTSNTARTGKEQLLLSNAVDQSLNKVDFTPLYGQKVFVEEKYMDSVDKLYILGSVRHRVMRSGGMIVDKAEEAEIVMEVRSGGVGTDTTESYLGTPEIALPGMLTVPEIRFAERKSQYGYSKIGMVLYDAKTKQILGEGGVAMAQSNDSNSFVMGVGPFQSGTLKGEVSKARATSPNQNRRQMPSTVAFATRPTQTVNSQPDIQFASGSQEK